MRYVVDGTGKNCAVWGKENCDVCNGKERQKSLQAKEQRFGALSVFLPAKPCSMLVQFEA